MRRIATMVLLLAATLAHGQWRQTTFRVPDTFDFPLGYCSRPAYDPDMGVVYLSGFEAEFILVLNYLTLRPLQRIDVGDRIGSLLRPPDRPVLFCTLLESERVIALDCQTHQRVAEYDVGQLPGAMLYCAPEGKLYVANWGDGSLSVIDLDADSVVATVPDIETEYMPQGLCYVPGVRRLFCLSYHDTMVTVIDVASDTVVARVKVDEHQNSIAYNAANNRVYVACDYEPLYSIDATSLSVARVPNWQPMAWSFACDSLRNRIYVPDDQGLLVVDGTADTVMAMVPIAGHPEWVGFDSRHDKVYVVSDRDYRDDPNNVAVIDGNSLALVRRLRGPVNPWMIGQLGFDCMFCAGENEDEPIAVYDGERVRMAGWLADECQLTGLYADSVGGKLYCLSSSPPLVMTTDPAKNRVLSSVPLAYCPGSICFNTVDRKAYVGNEDDWGQGIVAVLDGVGDTLLDEIVLGGRPSLLAYNPDDDVIYVGGGGSGQIDVIDGKGDSLVGHIGIGTHGLPDAMVYNSTLRKLYVVLDDGVEVIDARTNELLTKVVVDLRPEIHPVLNAAGSRLFCAGLEAVHAIDCVRDRLLDAIGTGAGHPEAICYNSIHDKLCVASHSLGDSARLSIIDCSRDSVVMVIPVGADYICYDRRADAVYCLGNGTLTAVGGETNTVLSKLKTWFHDAGVATAPDWPCVYIARTSHEITAVLKLSEVAVQVVPDAQVTFVRGRLNWTGTLAVMYDMGGRRVADIHRGGNDVSGLQPGVYFIRQNGVRRGTYARKVIVTR